MASLLAPMEPCRTRDCFDRGAGTGRPDVLEQFLDDADAAITAEAIFERALEHANAQFGERYIFAGESYDAEAYDATGAYQETRAFPKCPSRKDWMRPDLMEVTFFRARETSLRHSPTSSRTTTGVSDNVRASLDDIDAAIDQLTEAQAVVGGEMLTVLDAMDLATALDAELSMELSNATEVDAAEAYSDLFFYQQSYEAALGVTLQARSNLLFNRM